MPGYEQQVSQVDASRNGDGMVEVRHADGTGTAFYDRAMYQPPWSDYQVYEDRHGSQWYAIPGTPGVERRPVYEDGKPEGTLINNKSLLMICILQYIRE